MKVKLVTAYVPIAGHPRGPAEYGALGEKLAGVPVPKKAYYDQVQNLWLTKHLRKLDFLPTCMVYDNPEKNTLPYHAVNHEKTSWLVQASNEDPDADVLVWVDYGVFRLPGVNNQVIYEFFEKLDDKAIYVPGCWSQQDVIMHSVPCWRFCGSVIAVPKHCVDKLDWECRVAARQHIARTKTVEWEVNTWARVEKKTKLPFHWYAADHNERLFTGLDI